MLRKVSGEVDQFPDQVQQASRHGTLRIQAGLENPAVIDTLTVPPLHGARESFHLQFAQSQDFADIT